MSPKMTSVSDRAGLGSSGPPDKRETLSQALQLANNAVLLDNDHNFKPAIDTYTRACRLLQDVMETSSSDDDRSKLSTIQIMYHNRIHELQHLYFDSPVSSRTTGLSKSLPAIPTPHAQQTPAWDILLLQSNSTSLENANAEADNTEAAQLSSRQSPISNTPSLPPLSSRSMLTHDSSTVAETTVPSIYRSVEQDSDINDFVAAVKSPPYAPTGSTSTYPDITPLITESSISDSSMPDSLTGTTDAAVHSVIPHPFQKRSDHKSTTIESTSWLDTIDESATFLSPSFLVCRSPRSLTKLSSQSSPVTKHVPHTIVRVVDHQTATCNSVLARSMDVPAYSRPGISTAIINEGVTNSTSLSSMLGGERDNAIATVLECSSSLSATDSIISDSESHVDWEQSSDDGGETFPIAPFGPADLPDIPVSTPLINSIDTPLKPHQSHPSPACRVDPSSRAGSVGLNSSHSTPHYPDSCSNQPSRHSQPLAKSSPSRSLQPKPDTSFSPIPSGSPDTICFPSDPIMSSTPRYPSSDQDLRFRPQSNDLSIAHSDPAARMLESRGSDESPSPSTPFSAHTDLGYGTSSISLTSKPASRSSSQDKVTTSFRLSSQHSRSNHSISRESKSRSSSSTSRSNPQSLSYGQSFSLFPARRPTIYTPVGDDHTTSKLFFQSDIHSPFSPGTPNIDMANAPSPLEPCPESVMLRPYWLMRSLYQTMAHPRGGYLSTRLFVPRDVWKVRGVKIRSLEDKVANCDLLTAALLKVGAVDTYDADAVLEELQALEVVLDSVQSNLSKRLGNDVGTQGAYMLWKDVQADSDSTFNALHQPGPTTSTSTTAQPAITSSLTISSSFSKPSTQAKSYLTSLRKLRQRATAGAVSSISALTKDGPGSLQTASRDGLPSSLSSVPFTTSMNVQFPKRDVSHADFSGPNSSYVSSLARLFDASQVIEQLSRDVEDPGLRHSSPTHVGIELCSRHASEFFAFYICRFVMADLSVLLDKYIKRGSEWAVI